MSDPAGDDAVTVFDAVGGQPFFDALVERFYERVEQDPVLRPIYPEDLGPGKRALALFLGQYWGGPPIYSQEKGHPRLRMRHAPFVIRWQERQAWFDNMRAAVEESDAPTEIKARMIEYFDSAATHMINANDRGG